MVKTSWLQQGWHEQNFIFRPQHKNVRKQLWNCALFCPIILWFKTKLTITSIRLKKLNFLKPQFYVPPHIPRKLQYGCQYFANKTVHVTDVLQLVHNIIRNVSQNSPIKFSYPTELWYTVYLTINKMSLTKCRTKISTRGQLQIPVTSQ